MQWDERNLEAKLGWWGNPETSHSRKSPPLLGWRDKGRRWCSRSPGPGITQRKPELQQASGESWRRGGEAQLLEIPPSTGGEGEVPAFSLPPAPPVPPRWKLAEGGGGEGGVAAWACQPGAGRASEYRALEGRVRTGSQVKTQSLCIVLAAIWQRHTCSPWKF